MTAPKVTLYVDIVSPFAYIAFYILKVCSYPLAGAHEPSLYYSRVLSMRLFFTLSDLVRSRTDASSQNSAAFKQCDIKYVPIFLGGLMKTCGNTPPIAIKSKYKPLSSCLHLIVQGDRSSRVRVLNKHVTDKDKWINNERVRWAKYFNIPISKGAPPGFPINSLPIQRTLASLSISHPQSVESAISLLYENTWVQWSEPTKPENLLAILRTILGSDEEAKKVLERAKTDEAKGLLTSNTEQAFKDGAFGLPYFVGKYV